jgi:prevent-host-death family protein
MATWQLQDAKQRFSELVRTTLEDGPQVVTRHGEEVVVLVSADAWHALQQPRRDFKELLTSGPDFDALDLERERRLPRDPAL